MTNLVTELTEKAKALLPEERAQLAESLLASLEDSVESDDAWDQEIRKRVDDVDSGAARLVPADEVFARARQQLR